MTYIIPHINTLIVDIGTEFTKIGYTGDFRASHVFRTREGNRNYNQDGIFRILENSIKESGLDSIIVIDNGNFSNSEILKFIFPNKLCNSILFLKYELASLFGFGKTTGIVFNCSPSNISTSVILNGKILESCRYENNLSSTDVNLYEEDISRSVGSIYEMRMKYAMNKKNPASGCIILTGGFFKSDEFYKSVKKILLDKIGEDFGDFILRDKDLDCVFSGASIFGMNNHSKGLFISSYDWKELGTEILNKKALC